jgi:filamentous hemagglutinin
MRLPNAESARVERHKITEYLLNPTHRYGASKARFFAAFGFGADNWEELAGALRDHARRNRVVRCEQTLFGPRFDVDGELRTPSGAQPMVRSVWQMDAGDVAPRLITAYPLEVEHDSGA